VPPPHHHRPPPPPPPGPHGPAQWAGYRGYFPLPERQSLCALVGDEEAALLLDVLADSPPEQGGLAEILTAGISAVLERLAVLEERLAVLETNASREASE
jgi:hypothetical protein